LILTLLEAGIIEAPYALIIQPACETWNRVGELTQYKPRHFMMMDGGLYVCADFPLKTEQAIRRSNTSSRSTRLHQLRRTQDISSRRRREACQQTARSP
jgi:hypothetical protein